MERKGKVNSKEMFVMLCRKSATSMAQKTPPRLLRWTMG